MTRENVLKAMKSQKLKNSVGIPQRIIVDGAELLVDEMATLFDKIYVQKCIPEQWRMSVIKPIHKKGPYNQRQN